MVTYSWPLVNRVMELPESTRLDGSRPYARGVEPLPAPMLPTAGRLPTGSGWSFEFKWDGIRVCARAVGGRLERLQSRLGNDLADRFPELAVVGAELGDAVLDGELVVLSDTGVPDWGAVIRRRQARSAAAAGLAERYPATVMAFDVLALGAEDLRRRPYKERRAMLESLELADGWQVPPVSSDGKAVLATSLMFHLEGIVAKRTGSRYVSGRSARDWIKVRHATLIDAVVIGWQRSAAGGVTLLLAEAVPDRDAEPRDTLVYIGRCPAPASIKAVLAPLAATAPAVTVPGTTRDVQWVAPLLEVEVTAAARTPDGRLRQPKFVRARVDLR